MQKLLMAFLVGFLGLTAACNRADEGLVGVVTPGAANLFLEDITSETREREVTQSCPTSESMPIGSKFKFQVIKITARVEWLGTGKCEGGITPRECQPGTLNAGEPCIPDLGLEGPSKDCHLNTIGDGEGVCGKRPCQFDYQCCLVNPAPGCTGGDICGTVAARLVFAAADTDPRPNVAAEVGVVLFDNGPAQVQLQDASGSPVVPTIFVLTGDSVTGARDLTYTREFAVLSSSTAGPFRC
ncbi:MAG: hypothetical protein HY509_03090, partial [Acidobacteria bacterium]|nr:hypothetical protein [Acidobacteriota bacterium]